MNITFHQLEIFEAVVISGSLTKASRALQLSQPCISQQLYKLEENLGVQLIIRNREGSSKLTPAGEYWHKVSAEILEHMDTVTKVHEETYLTSNVKISLGVTPNLRGNFISAAARIAQEQEHYLKFELVTAESSARLVEKLRLHKINCAVVSDTDLIEDAASYKITKLFEDQIAWVVPSAVSNQDIRDAIQSVKVPGDKNPVLRRYVDVAQQMFTKHGARDWFSINLPESVASFSTPSFVAAVDLVAAGLATSTVALSLVPNLSSSVLRKVKFFEIEGTRINAVLAVRKHLMSHSSYAHFHNQLVEYCRDEYWPAMKNLKMEKFSFFRN
jgi:DNA-binding transcriptional LysR family regulator|tara:strand:- start:279 stop:1265 length:987 start_codon:yes stop_codon:yes gene_type:complete